MSFKYIKSLHKKDKDLPDRAYELTINRSLLNGSFYDVLKYEWGDEKNDANEYVPLKKRKPSVCTGTNLLRTVVEDSNAMLFGEGRFPDVIVLNEKDITTERVIRDLIKETQLVEKMRTAAFKGSIGSVAIYMRVLTNREGQNRVFFDVQDTLYLTPEWDENEPDRLIAITELRKIKGRQVKALGYPIDKDELDKVYWFKRVFDEAAERWFTPWAVEKKGDKPVVPTEDPNKSVVHNLGFCPWVWIKNLHGGDDIDGGCTFGAGVSTCLEIDGLASQQARGLRYSMDPLLVIKEAAGEAIPADTGAVTDGVGPVANPSGQGGILKGPATALVMDSEGDAKYLEITGTGISAATDTIEKLRGYAIEAMHGSKVNPDQINSHQGAKALEILHAPLVRLTDNLRASYGEYGLLQLLRLFIQAASVKKLTVAGALIEGLAKPEELALRWHSWFPETEMDLQTKATTLTTLVGGKLISRETATEKLAANYDIEKVQDELARIDAEDAAAAKAALEMQTAQSKLSKPDDRAVEA